MEKTVAEADYLLIKQSSTYCRHPLKRYAICEGYLVMLLLAVCIPLPSTADGKVYMDWNPVQSCLHWNLSGFLQVSICEENQAASSLTPKPHQFLPGYGSYMYSNMPELLYREMLRTYCTSGKQPKEQSFYVTLLWNDPRHRTFYWLSPLATLSPKVQLNSCCSVSCRKNRSRMQR